MKAESGRWALIVSGGAKEMPPEERDANRSGVLAAARAGRAVLETGGSAVAAVEAAIRTMEDLPIFNAGFGSSLNADREVEMCAGIMSGRDLAVGAVAAIRGVAHPISVARRLMAEKWVMLTGDGARRFAEATGAELVPDNALVTENRLSEAAEADTVIAVALDMNGDLAAGTSTGGLTGQPVGRIGDSPVAGGGYYADNHAGAVALSGDGEALARLAAAARIVARIGEQGPEPAIRRTLERLPHLGGDGGAVAIAKDGTIGWWHNSPGFAVASSTSDDPEPQARLGKDEE